MAGNDPYGNDELDSEGVPDLETPLNQDEGMIPPRTHPQGVDQFGVTAAEERGDEPLAERVKREVPEVDEDDLDAADADDAIGGRLLEPGSEDVDAVDDEKDSIASLVTEDEGALSAEEAAMHLTEEP